MMGDDGDTITRCPQCRKLVGARWYKGPWPGMKSSVLPGWRLYMHKSPDVPDGDWCEGGMLVVKKVDLR